MPAPPTYASFLVRLWREDDPERGKPDSRWQGEVQQIQTGQRRDFGTIDDLLGILRHITDEEDAPAWMVGK